MSKRRHNGEGTIYQTNKGLWRCELTLGYDENGKRIKKTISSMDLAALQKKLNDAKYLNDRTMLAAPSGYTLSEWTLFWLENYKKNSVRPKTYECYHYAYQNHIQKSLFAGKKIENITPAMLQAYINALHEKNYAISTIKKVYIVLNQVFDQAVKNNLIYQNPCQAVVLPKGAPREVVAMTVEEQSAFEASCPDTTYGNFLLFALGTGMRCGEIVALTWDDVDFEARTIHVERSAGLVTDFSDGKQKMMVSDPKTSSGKRMIPLGSNANKALVRQKGKHEVFCFPATNGAILRARNIRRAMNQVLDNAGISTHYTIHALRHTFATRLLEKGANIKAVSEILGHRSIQITLDTYSHVSTDFMHDTIRLLDEN